MRTFLIQCDEHNRPMYDFCYALTEAERYMKWKSDSTFSFVYKERPMVCPDPSTVVPVGSIEFVKEFVEMNYGRQALEALVPIYPECWRKYYAGGMWSGNAYTAAKQTLATIALQANSVYGSNTPAMTAPPAASSSDNTTTISLSEQYLDMKLHLKRKKNIKDPRNGDYTIKHILDNKGDFNDEEWYVGMAMDALAEWRVFVHNGEIQDICFYKGDMFTPTPFGEMKCLVAKYNKFYKDNPMSGASAYTLDVGWVDEISFLPIKMQKNDKHPMSYKVIEFHEFYSCGLYGFNDYVKIMYMLSQQWFRIQARISTMINK